MRGTRAPARGLGIGDRRLEERDELLELLLEERLDEDALSEKRR